MSDLGAKRQEDSSIARSLESVVFCVPVYNDWESAIILLEQIERVITPLGLRATVVLVDDGSTLANTVSCRCIGNVKTRILTLKRNLGHQRAIAIGLAAISQHIPCDAVVVMDGDGEDQPEHIPTLLQQMNLSSAPAVVFAKRMRRTENLKFKIGYGCFKIFHRLLTGRPSDVGNYSAVPAVWLQRLTCASELWIHYAAAVACSRLPIVKVPCDRGHRFAGKSHMKLTSLVVHGLSAISVFGETVGVRICIALSAVSGLMLTMLLVVVYLRLMTDLAVPGWATNATGLLLILLVNLLILTMNSVLVILGARNSASFIPSRDWKEFVAGWTAPHE